MTRTFAILATVAVLGALCLAFGAGWLTKGYRDHAENQRILSTVAFLYEESLKSKPKPFTDALPEPTPEPLTGAPRMTL